MCWVMPPASPSATSVSRTASSSEVLPWSTWPMIVTTGRAVLELVGGVLELGLGVRLVGGVDDLDLLVELVRDDLDRVVGQRLRERRHLAQAHELLDDLGDRDAEVLGDVLDRRAGVDPDRVGLQALDVLRRRLRVGAAAPAATAARRAARRAATGAAGTAAGALAARGLRVDHDAAHAAARAGGALALQRGARGALARRRRLACRRPACRRRALRRWRAGGAARAAPGGRSRRRCARAAAAPASSWPLADACLGFGLPVSAASASSVSTAVAAALTSRP